LQLEVHKYSEWAALIPEILVVIFLIWNIFYPVADRKDLLNYWWIGVIIIILSIIILLFALRKKRRLKILYTRVDTWTVDVIKTKIIEFKFYDNNNNWKGYDDNNIWYRIITSDGSVKYKWPRYSVRELKLPKYRWKEPEYLTIKWKNYYIWDYITVCVDPSDKSNYIFDIEEMTIR
jgi:hypothetical protein